MVPPLARAPDHGHRQMGRDLPLFGVVVILMLLREALAGDGEGRVA